jgi:NDP-4-keto-2,6-dideoxyhexose 3-C-methyltransferase
MPDNQIITRETCRVCGKADLTPILSLGDLYVSDFLSDGEEHLARKYPLELVLCNVKDGGCGLLQLKHTVAPETLYRNYWYRSGMNKSMTDELQGIAAKIESLVDLKVGDFVMDIAANDGTLLRGYTTTGLNLIGYEPARNLGQYNSVGTKKIFPDFFAHGPWEKEFGDQKAKAVTAIAMFYDLEDPNQFVGDVAKILDKEGVFIIQMSYLPLMLSQNAFDNICHEHLEYYSLLSMENLLKRHGLEVFDVDLNDVNGGSFRLYMRHAGAGKTINVPVGAPERIAHLRAEEDKLGLHDRPIYDAFVARIKEIGEKVNTFIKGEVAAGKKVHVYGASTKGNTLLQFFNLDSNLITAAAERNPDKWGKKTVGTMIPIISEEDARKAEPEYFLILPWHFMDEFKSREAAHFARGGKFIVPLPQFGIIDEFSA